MKHSLLILCIAVLIVILNLGLWPFHSPRNDVTWLKDQSGVRFGDYGTVMSTGALNEAGSTDPYACSVEVRLQAAHANKGGTFLTLYAPNQPARLSLHQSLGDLELRAGKDHRHHFYVNDVFRAGRPVLVTITSGAQGTAVYLNGAPIRIVRGFHMSPGHCGGRLIVGDSPWQQDPWPGQVTGLALYASSLSAAKVLEHHRTWEQNGQPAADPDLYLASLYLFDERHGDIVHNHVAGGADLFIPGTYFVQDKIFLEPFWDEFEVSGSYVKGVLKNIIGFVPLGFCFCAYLALARKIGRAGLVTLVLGFSVSLIIEVLQGYLPTRDSGTTDLITNTLGTGVGVMFFHAFKARLAAPFFRPS